MLCPGGKAGADTGGDRSKPAGLSRAEEKNTRLKSKGSTMQKYHFRSIAALTCALVLSGCLGGGGGGGAVLPAADNVLPAEAPDGSTDGIEDYLSPGSGTWRVNLDGVVQATTYGSAVLTEALVYDPDRDEWTLNVDGANFVLLNYGAGGYLPAGACAPPATSCAGFVYYDDDPSTSQYGTFGYIAYADTTRLVEYFVHAGLKTAPADMPATGTGTYAGTFAGLVNTTFGIGYDYLDGNADVIASFAPGGGSIAFASTGIGTEVAGSSYGLSGTAVISGNTYAGTLSGSYTDGVGTATFSASGSTLSGAFYGPGADETAGVVYYSGPLSELAGGFWASQTGYVP